MLYYEDIKLGRRRRGMYRRETSYIYVLGAKPLDEPLTNTGDTLQRCHRGFLYRSVFASINFR